MLEAELRRKTVRPLNCFSWKRNKSTLKPDAQRTATRQLRSVEMQMARELLRRNRDLGGERRGWRENCEARVGRTRNGLEYSDYSSSIRVAQILQ